MSRPRPLTVWLGVVVLMLGAFARIGAFTDSPPGMQHDEMFKAIEGRQLAQAGDFRVFYPTNQGHEGGYVWALAVSEALLGVNLLSVRFPAMIFGLLAVALTYRAAGQIGGRRAGFVAAGMVAVSFWGAFIGRVGLRASMLPACVLLVALGVWALTSQRPPRRPILTAALTGLALGGSLYTYTSAFALFGGVAALIVALALFDRRLLRARWKLLTFVSVVAVIVALPMLNARLTDRNGFNRASTITRPLTDALAGKPTELLDNAVKLAGMFAFTGDPEARYNLPERPAFPVAGALVYVGAALMVWRLRRQPVLAYWLGVGLVGLVPSLLTVGAPSFLRSVAVLPVAAACIGLSVGLLKPRIGWAVAAGLVGLTGLLDLRALWVEWPTLPTVQAIYRDDLQQLTVDIRRNGVGRALISTPDVELDALMLPFELPDGVSATTLFDGDTNLVVADGATLYVSPFAPITPPHQQWLTADYGTERLPDVLTQDGQVAFEVYRLGESIIRPTSETAYRWDGSGRYPKGELSEWAAPLAYPVNFGGVVELVGVDLSDRVLDPKNDGVNIQLYLKPLVERESLPIQAFVHVYRRNGVLHAQRDLLGVPTSQWRRDMTIIQDNFVVMGDSGAGAYVVTVGFYNYQTGERLPVLGDDGEVLADHVLVGRVRVRQ